MSFSEQQREYLNNASARWNFKTGAVRSGKTYLDFYMVPKRIRARIGREGLAVILGVSKGTIERNILEPMRELWGPTFVGVIGSNNTCQMFGERVHCLGAEKVSQVAKLQGASIKYCYGDEVARWNPEVFAMLQSRLDKPYSCFDGTLNPQGPNHWLKEFLDSPGLDIYNQHYTIFDNPFLSRSFVDSLCKEYEGTVYYKRYILGEWALADGLVYPMFREDRHVVRGPVKYDKHKRYFAAVDYGTVNPFAVGVFEYDGRNSVMIRELHYDGRKQPRVDNEEYYRLMTEAFGTIPIEKIVVDPSAAGFIQTIVKYGRYVVEGANNDVLNGIQEVTKYLNYGMLKIHESCTETIKEFQQYAWDDKSGEDRVVKESDHHMDLLRYYVYGIARAYNAWVV